ncbi:eukaryotic aspartyl protease family protein [Artemisia annua]|uniref:Eukaryotic aspartyl protease family protein n=1 Tax=Artemisia annua TaxID=35608 RepID=A0A2U1QP11_ARTAN|nr:eukaryotic aspartyl protease family protein [Artemisia annua]
MSKRRKVSVIGFVFIVIVELCDLVSCNVVFHVQHKFAHNKRSLNVLKSHDAIRHRRFLSASVEVPLGGDGSPTSAALYFTKIQIGSPPKEYHVQVDTGSDLLWVNCIECDKCPTKSDLGVPLALYDPKGSSSAKTVGCNDGFCKSTFDAPGSKSDECKVGMLCAYAVTYGDGSSTAGFFVNDIVKLSQVSGNRQTTSMSGNVTFG